VSRPLVVLAVLAAAATLSGLVILLASDDGGGRPRGVVWAQPARIVTPPELPNDRVLYGQVRNDGPGAVTLDVRDLRVVDRAGRPLRSDARFLQAFARGGPGRVTLGPGRTAPLTVSWRGGGAWRVALGTVELPIP
jgi:hypothetical protein